MLGLLAVVAGGFAVVLERNEAEQYSAALKSAGQIIISLYSFSDVIRNSFPPLHSLLGHIKGYR